MLKNKSFVNSSASFEEVANLYFDILSKESKGSTLYGHKSCYRMQIEPTFKNKKINNITNNDIIAWHEMLTKKNLKIRYKQKCHMILSSILDIGTRFFNVESNVCKNIGNFREETTSREKIKKEKLRYITLEEFNNFISYIDYPLWISYFGILFYTGMRKGELQALKWSDIDFDKKQIHINKTLTVKTFDERWKLTSTKNYKNRTIYIDNKTNKYLSSWKEYLVKNGKYNIKHFVLGDEEPLKQHKIDVNKNKYFKLANMKPITNHEFRHSNVSLLVNEYLKEGNTDVTKFFVMMSNRLGHSVRVMQETYMHLFPDSQKDIVNLINNL